MSDTVSINYDRSIVAGFASTTGLIPGGAEVTNGNADIIFIEVPSLWACLADAIGPDSTSNIAGLIIVNSFATSVDYWIALIAFFADSFLEVELLASALNFTANSIFVEIISIGAFDAGITAPDSAPEIVIELGEECGVVKLFLTELQLLCGYGAC